MLNKELPLKTTKDVDGYFNREGTSADVFEFEPEKDKQYVYKELRPVSNHIELSPGLSLEEKASFMNKVYNILREYYGDSIAKTFYIVAKDRFKRKIIMIIQEKIDGIPWANLDKHGPVYLKALEQRKKIIDMADKIENDPRFNKFNVWKVDLSEIWYEENTIVDETAT